MDGTQSSHVALPPFILKTYEMVDDASTDSIVSWSQSNESFIVWNPPEFVRDLLPRYFKHNNFSSFIRQLNTYGFRKVDPEQWEFANEDFIRGQPHLLKNIYRRKPVHSHSTQNQQGTLPLTETERKGYEDEISKRKCDKESLTLELQRHKLDDELINMQIKVLTERFQHLELRQKSFLSSLAQTLQKPGLGLDLVPPSDVCERKRRLSKNSCLHEQSDTENNQVETLEVMATGEDSDATSISILNKKLFELLDTSVMSWEGTLLHASETYMQNNSAHHLDISTNRAETPSISDEQTNVDCGSKVYGIDMNSEPAAAVAQENSSVEESVAQPTTIITAGKNDVFWEQFLTENPGSNDASEVKSERKDIADRRNESNPEKFWWNMRNVGNIAEQLGQLTSAERT